MPVDYTFPAGHRVGIVLIANLNALQRNGTTGTTVTLNTKLSKVEPADRRRLRRRGRRGRVRGHGRRPRSTVGGAVPATLGLTLGTPRASARSRRASTKEYTASTAATVISTAGDATLTVSDPGHLTNGAFSLAEPLRVELTPSRAGPARLATSP